MSVDLLQAVVGFGKRVAFEREIAVAKQILGE
jgi:hypothetical protein